MRPDFAESPSARPACWLLSSEGVKGCLDMAAVPWQAGLAAADTLLCETGQTLLGGNGVDILSLGGAASSRNDCLDCYESDTFLIGMAQLPAGPSNIEAQSHRIYRALIERPGQRSLYRIWNFVPGINDGAPGPTETYKLFCNGRASAFAERFGEGDTANFPSASATGCANGLLTVVFLAGHAGVTHWENPDQVPAYRYPVKYGPKSPSFARASRFTDPQGGEWVMVAGTAAIKGSETLFPGDLARQIPVTFDNLSLILGQVGLALDGRGSGRRRHFKVFLRDRNQLARLAAAMREIAGPLDSWSVFEADICRADLEVEIELTAYPAR